MNELSAAQIAAYAMSSGNPNFHIIMNRYCVTNNLRIKR